MAVRVFKLPDLGEGLTESEIVSWRVAEGDKVELNQILGEVETAKAVVELPSPFAGVVKILHEAPGTTVNVGEPIVSFEVAGEANTGPAEAGEAPGGRAGHGAAGEPAAAPVSASAREAVLVGYGAQTEGTGKPARRRRTFDPPPPGAAPTAPPFAGPPVPAGGTEPEVKERPRSTPPVRKLARELGVDLALVRGTGRDGLITRADVEGFRAGAAMPPAMPPAGAPAAADGRWLGGAAERESRLPVKGVRRQMAAAMVASAFTAPHATSFLTVDATAGLDLLDRLRGQRAFAGTKLTPLTLTAKALCIALDRHPLLNARWDEEHQEIVQQNYVNLGIAAATPRGLLVPNIKDAQALDLVALAGALAELASRARAGRTAPAELSGGTISLTNIGVFGIDAGTPILNPGETAILATGAVQRRPWEYRGGIELRQVMTLSLSFDHRLVDGEQAARFLSDVGAIISDPAVLLAMV
ncbi:dihydrolipoamide acetyltransferase family protein [Arthrobacter mangrovi]|uniref:Dihydrolipoamide acetyltransferase component of pyruvate dehydrogenase complex n=1 Tax=Arthrobacter mangrovi TaxID=2966350 RepID=A0ABQ5MQN6_9MICC|nr:dihydrolipoamide acetyltransferase family protein [Arthrobacter mangrovi]GLB66284.1 dihydrolipoamide acetyltransferase component of pyruvate dehydrogenase complex [Arthrobacter mangrovi]